MWECGLRIFKNYRYDAAYTGEWGLEGQALEHMGLWFLLQAALLSPLPACRWITILLHFADTSIVQEAC